uniref:Uncharacterized protein n=1 Tax=Cacopsylla melanoneura TaxID=428564 RepID=A0A8D8TQG9_9HEMI
MFKTHRRDISGKWEFIFRISVRTGNVIFKHPFSSVSSGKDYRRICACSPEKKEIQLSRVGYFSGIRGIVASQIFNFLKWDISLGSEGLLPCRCLTLFSGIFPLDQRDCYQADF